MKFRGRRSPTYFGEGAAQGGQPGAVSLDPGLPSTGPSLSSSSRRLRGRCCCCLWRWHREGSLCSSSGPKPWGPGLDCTGQPRAGALLQACLRSRACRQLWREVGAEVLGAELLGRLGHRWGLQSRCGSRMLLLIGLAACCCLRHTTRSKDQVIPPQKACVPQTYRLRCAGGLSGCAMRLSAASMRDNLETGAHRCPPAAQVCSQAAGTRPGSQSPVGCGVPAGPPRWRPWAQVRGWPQLQPGGHPALPLLQPQSGSGQAAWRLLGRR